METINSNLTQEKTGRGSRIGAAPRLSVLGTHIFVLGVFVCAVCFTCLRRERRVGRALALVGVIPRQPRKYQALQIPRRS